MKDTYRICISSPPDREKLVAEIFSETRNGQRSIKSTKFSAWSFILGPTGNRGELVTKMRSRRWMKQNRGLYKVNFP